MSSYVIAKSEYMKAAGLVTGLSEELRHFWMYDIETQRNSTAEDFKRHFTEFFTMNALSVQEQYNDPEAYTDTNEYNKEFSEYRKLGKQLVYNDGKALTDAISELSAFFSSAMYQTEYEPYMYKMQMYFNSLIVELWDKAYHHETESWSELKITPPSHNYQTI